MAVTSDVELERVRKLHQLRSYRIVSVLRIGVLVFVIAAMIVGTPTHEWGQQTVLVALYGVAALCALALAFSPARRLLEAEESSGVRRWEPLVFTAVDIVALTGFQLLSAHGLYPLLIMTLLPVLAGVDISSRRAVTVLAFSLLGFVLAGVHDGVLLGRRAGPIPLFSSRCMHFCAPQRWWWCASRSAIFARWPG
ncbi:putative sensor histidine kinase NarS domain protein [Mycobacterium kansasii]|uniref:Putative sensor histidine kinase NarS domain protein n=1 Tax=Mycobacterium kansasii TaxID=1768 RepID=A0A1V3WT94_MYCKA|nr:putative sensor histidine kinase NarS domain protein [Mycobacterium kansasii]